MGFACGGAMVSVILALLDDGLGDRPVGESLCFLTRVPSRIPPMAVTESRQAEGAQVVAEDRQYLIHSWSVQSALAPIPVAGGEGRYFWDYEGKRYLDFAAQLVNLALGHQHPKVVAAVKEQADRLCTIAPSVANDKRSELARLV